MAKCTVCNGEFDYIERDACHITLHRIRYIKERDLRVTDQLTRDECHHLVTAELITPRSREYTLCSECTCQLYKERDITELADNLLEGYISAGLAAEPESEADKEVLLEEVYDQIYEDPMAYGVTFPIILNDNWREFSEPDTCGSCESPFKDDDLVWVVKAVDLLGGEPIDEDRPTESTYKSDRTYLCTDCEYMVKYEY